MVETWNSLNRRSSWVDSMNLLVRHYEFEPESVHVSESVSEPMSEYESVSEPVSESLPCPCHVCAYVRVRAYISVRACVRVRP